MKNNNIAEVLQKGAIKMEEADLLWSQKAYFLQR